MVGSDDGETALFSGIEKGTGRADAPDEPTGPPKPPLDPVEMATNALRNWLRGLSYRELHASVIGFGPWFLAIVTGQAALLALAVGVTAACLGQRHGLTKPLRAIVKEPWYCLGGSVLGWLLGSSALAWGQIAATLAGVIG